MSVTQRYILAKTIARGGMAEIYLGKHIGDDGFQRIVAIKRILPHYAKESEYVEMFRDEAHICKRLRHPNIVRVEGFEEVDESYAIIMEYVDGSDLRSLLAAVEKNKDVGRIPVPMALFMIAEAARGLHYAHERRDEITQKPLEIVHRDISPQNILLSYEGEVKVTDFGIADAENGFKQTETKAGIVKGKYSYMSPEQISAKPVDRRTDVFALAIVLWEVLAMKRLFHGATEVETIEIVRNCRISHKLVDVNKEVDADLERVILKGLQKDVNKRYQTAEEFEKEIRKYMAKKYPDFTVNEVSTFIKTILDNKRKAIAEEIKKTLESNVFNTGSPDKSASKEKAGTANRILEISVDAPGAASTNLTISKKYNQSQISTPRNAATGSLAKPGAQRPLATSQSGLHRADKHSFPMHKSNLILIAAAVAAVILGFFVYNQKISFSRKPNPRILLRTNPDTSVLIHVNEQPMFNGSYQKTPVWIELPEGNIKLQITRPGYEEVITNIETKPGMKQKTNRIPLVPIIPFAPTRVYVQGAYDQELKVVLDEGYTSAILNKENRFSSYLSDLGRNLQHRIVVFDQPSDKKLMTCVFTPTSKTKDKAALVTIDVARKKCDMRNPKE